MIHKWAEDTQPVQPYHEPRVETSVYGGLDRDRRLCESGLANNRRYDRRETNMESVAQESAADTTLTGEYACPQFSILTHTHTLSLSLSLSLNLSLSDTHTHTHICSACTFFSKRMVPRLPELSSRGSQAAGQCACPRRLAPPNAVGRVTHSQKMQGSIAPMCYTMLSGSCEWFTSKANKGCSSTPLLGRAFSGRALG